jgi:hypothetical protein
VIAGFTDIINTVGADVTAMAGTPPFTVAAAETDIYNALVTV